MWTTSASDGEPDADALRRMGAPENEIPVALPQNRVLVQGPDLAVALVSVQAYTTGVAFELAARARPGAAGLRPEALNEVFWAHRGGAERFLMGVQFADGRRVTSAWGPERSGELVLHPGGGSGGDTLIDQSWWLSPLPPEGPLRLVVRCPELGIAETVVELDGTAIRRAGESAVVLWPWEPRHERPDLPHPPDVPPDSWFAG